MKKQYLINSKRVLLSAVFLFLASAVEAKIDTVFVGANNSFAFSPSSMNVNLGDTVRWVWGSGVHTTTSTNIPTNASSWDSPMTSSNQTFTYVPTELGTYDYVCTPHSPSMAGSFTVACNIDTSISRIGDTLMANVGQVSYQWVNCDSGYVGNPNDTDRSFVPVQAGNYAVIITQNTCMDTSFCYNSSGITGMEEISKNNKLGVFPNPGNGQFNIQHSSSFSNASYKVYNSLGRLIEQKSNINKLGFYLDISSHSEGLYILEVQDNEHFYRMKLIKR